MLMLYDPSKSFIRFPEADIVAWLFRLEIKLVNARPVAFTTQ
jgi:hypothetical protein